MRLLILASLLIAGCSESMGLGSVKNTDVECTFQFSTEPVCSYTKDRYNIKVSLTTKKSADDEIALTNAKVNLNGKRHTLTVSPDTTMMQGNIGIISFADINFDGIPDIAVSTSFGLANQYFDYWVYDPKTKRYHSVGNYPKLIANPVDKILSVSVKASAASYQTMKYFWDGDKLVQRK